MYYSGFADEAGTDLSVQIRATKELGWQHIEMRNVKLEASSNASPGVSFPEGALSAVSGANIHDIPDAAFDYVAQATKDAGIHVNCFGSALGKTSLAVPFEAEWENARRAASRMARLNTKLIRVMSYKGGDDNTASAEIFRRLNEMQKLFADGGAQMVHENCTGFGGKSASHTLRLLDAVPGLKLVFDTGNPIREPDYDRPEGENNVRPRQSSWAFYQAVKPFVAYIHIKDGIYHEETGTHDWVMPGDGQGDVKRIITDLLQSGYDGGVSIEPHLPPVRSHEPDLNPHEARYRNYVDYGRRLMQMVDDACR